MNNAVEDLIKESFTDLIKAVITNGTFGQLIFPQYRAGAVRYSEQELRQIFLKNVEDDKSYFYSVETPTKYVYSFSNLKKPVLKDPNDKLDGDSNYKSARFDTSLYRWSCRIFIHSGRRPMEFWCGRYNEI